MEISLLTAFLGGTLALLSPCSALLLPAFFASTVGSGPRLLLHGVIFYIGLAAVLIPVGLGAGAIGLIFATQRDAIVLITAVLLVLLGSIQFLGFGFDPARFIPGAQNLQNRAASSTGLFKTLLLGAAGGVAGFCAGPILGAVLTLAAAQGDMVSAGALLALYSAGMVIPLLLLTLLWTRLGSKGQKILRGRPVNILGREFHTISMITGTLLIVVGVVFWRTNGLLSAPQLVPVSTQAWLQERLQLMANPIVDVSVLAIAAVLFLSFRALRRKRAKARKECESR
ncbi:UNVERIFIED_CONTAM: cytochrome c biogenesis CcdA family protein [Actinomycetes bacterium ARC8]|nr:cytochrome c biogenesis CcdA family protein [Actinomycetes bacterium ARC8]